MLVQTKDPIEISKSPGSEHLRKKKRRTNM